MNTEGHQPNLALFFKPPIDAAVQETYWQEHRPVGQISHQSTLEFNVSGASADCIQLDKTRLYLKARILKKDGSPVTQEDKVSFVNLSQQSLFRQVDASLNQQVISPGVGTAYPYKSLIDTLLNFNDEAKQSQLQSQLFYKDSSMSMDATDPLLDGNAGLMLRWQHTKSGSVEMEGPIHCDVCKIDRLLLNGVSLGFKFYPSRDSFCLTCKDSDAYKVDIEEAILKVCRVKLRPNVIVGQGEALKKCNALYPMPQSHIKAFNIAKGAFSWTQDDTFQGRIPELLILGLVSSAAFNGDVKRSPFNFKNYNANFVAVYEDGHTSVQPFQPCYETGSYVVPYLSLFTAIDNYNKSIGNGISRNDYRSGYALYVFRLNNSSRDFMQLDKKGNLKLALRFATPLKESVTAVVYAQFSTLLQIDEARNVIV